MTKDLQTRRAYAALGLSWIVMWAALAIHVADEAVTGFLSVYNPTVRALRARLGFWPMATFEFRQWLAGLVIAVLLLALCTPVAFRNSRWIRPVFYVVAIVAGVANALGHTLATVFGQTVDAVQFPRPAPGSYSSPFLLLAAVNALAQLRRTRKRSDSTRGPAYFRRLLLVFRGTTERGRDGRIDRPNDR